MVSGNRGLHLVTQETGFPKHVTAIQPVRRMESVWPSKPQRAGMGRRRPNALQGRGLEALGHAVEYLLDSRVFVVETRASRADRDAIHLLKRLSRMIFDECPESLTLWQRLGRLRWQAAARLDRSQPKCADC